MVDISLLTATNFLVCIRVSRFTCAPTSYHMKKHRHNQQVLSLQKEVISHLAATDQLVRAAAQPLATETTDRSTPVCMVFAHEL